MVITWRTKSAIELTGRISGSFFGKIYLFFEDRYRAKDSISTTITDGRFNFSCTASLPVLARLHLGQDSYIADFYIDGPHVYLECSNKIRIINAGKDTLNVLTIDLVKGSKMEALKSGFLQTLHISSADAMSEAKTTDYYDRLAGFVRKKALDTSLGGTYEGKSVLKLMGRPEITSKEIFSAGAPFHDVSLPDVNGTNVNTGQLRGNYFLIICWASWCVPCRSESPALREIYKTYKDKGLTMTGISFDQSRSKWRQAIMQDSLQWVQLRDSLGFRGDLAKYYGIDAIPGMFLLNKDRKMIMSGAIDDIKGMFTIPPWFQL
jgi:peroxiredoxin